MEITIEGMSPLDRDEVVAIFNEGVRAGDLALDVDDPGTQDLGSGRNLVVRAGGQIVGWATVDPVGEGLRPGLAAFAVFVKPDYRRKGIGQALLDAAADLAARNGISTLAAGILPRNVPALMLHKKSGFRATGMIQKAGIANDEWHSAVLLELRLTASPAAASSSSGDRQSA